MDIPPRDSARRTILDRDIANRIDDLLTQTAPACIRIDPALVAEACELLRSAALFQPHADRVADMLEVSIPTAGHRADAADREGLLDRGAVSAPEHEAAQLLLSQIAETALPDAVRAAGLAAAYAALARVELAPLARDV